MAKTKQELAEILRNDPKLRAIVKRKADRIAQNAEDIIVVEDIIDTGELLHSITSRETPTGAVVSMKREGLKYIEHGSPGRPGAHIMERAIQREKVRGNG